MADYQSFLDKLTAKTTAGRVSWKPTYESDTFAASLEGEFTVTIGRSEQTFVFEMRDQRENRLVQLSADKTRAWEQGYEEAAEHYELLRRLHDAARVVALDIHKQLSRAESLLDKV